MGRATVYYDGQRGLDNSDVAEALRRAQHNFGAGNVETYMNSETCCLADSVREGGPISISYSLGVVRGMSRIRMFFPLPTDKKPTGDWMD